jgi:hypothetical protein
MIIHCSKSLAAKLTGVSPTPLDESSPLGSWHAHLFTLDRRQCVVFCHDETRYCLFLAGLCKPQFAELGSRWFRELFTATLAVIGVVDTRIKKVELMLGPVRFDRATDRSVQSTINIARQDLKAWVFQLPNVMDVDPLKVSTWLNERPVTIRGKFIHPDREMQQLVTRVG